ncbi:FAD-linked oxidase C-terminal domain-containing protein [Galbitalea sp. SE-J8]|uniref:FAD-binding oxidoreductase n=1 Tax=Galbitalea sp. SE-J8 TaxID=3054952 RepID=UPI00259CFC81|nr:FAD-linked oxidase C-terminal domain-containing protein [Galbitalea sp. SE-J8]MDM4762606.1 FAD-linked oxidase C-terminal domain-containing protein [Galbitalea sp. SE-J8]
MATVLDLLRARLGDAVSTDAAELDAARADKSGHAAPDRPLAVVNAREIDDIVATMRIATQTRTPVVTRGAGTGLAGGAVAGAGELVLSTARMTALVELNVDDEYAVVEPGIINGDLNALLAPHGLWFAPDPASRAISTVGGNIATNAGGLLCAKYGVTRDAVLGLTVVLADGRVLDLGRRTVKGVAGLDLTALLVGSEGTLGVIARATVRLRPLPRGGIATIAAYFPDVERAARAASVISASGLVPAIMEVLDARSVAVIAAYLGQPAREAAFLLVHHDGPGAAADADDSLAVIRSLGGEAELTTDPDESEGLFRVRRSFHGAMERRGRVLIEDVCVPRSALPEMFARIADIERRFGLEIPTIAHAGDGNLHPNFVFTPDPLDPDGVPEHVWRAADEMFVAALALGGTLTGEHGVGLLKKRWIGDELGDDQQQLQRGIKALFDPLGILNPGKAY